jgi:hypothetical protein
MMDKFHKLLQKKQSEGKVLSPMEKEAKMHVMQHLHKMASDEMAQHLPGMKKVSVMSDSPEGLEAGLDKAKELMHGQESGSPADEEEKSDSEESMEPSEGGSDSDSDEDEDAYKADAGPERGILSDGDMESLSDEELDHHMARLADHKAKRGMGK